MDLPALVPVGVSDRIRLDGGESEPSMPKLLSITFILYSVKAGVYPRLANLIKIDATG